MTNPNNNGPQLTWHYDPMGNIQTNSNLGTYAYTPNHPDAVASVTDRAGTVVYSASYDADDPWKSPEGEEAGCRERTRSPTTRAR